MNIQQQQVKEFMLRAGQECPNYPTNISRKDVGFNCRLIEEELDEYHSATVDEDLVKIAESLGNLLCAVYGISVDHGIDIEPIFEETHRSNLTEFIDGYRRPDGKWVKGKSYSPPDIFPLLLAQGQPKV